LTTLWMWLGLPHPSIAGFPLCVCTHPINLLCCAHGNKCMRTHDAICDTFSTIQKKSIKKKDDYDERWKLKNEKSEKNWVNNEVYTSLL
jgi:hypothetical protein